MGLKVKRGSHSSTNLTNECSGLFIQLDIHRDGCIFLHVQPNMGMRRPVMLIKPTLISAIEYAKYVHVGTWISLIPRPFLL